MILRHFVPFAALAFLPTLAAAQTDDCASATPISGEGSWAYSNIGSTTDGPNNCAQMGSDVWFAWTATSTDTYTLTTCNGTSYDSALSVYDSACPASNLLACNDDTCGTQSSVNFSAVSGDTYLFQMGGWQGNQGNGTIDVFVAPPSPCDDPATGPDVIVGSLNGISNWGGVGTKSAYSIGTTSCNYGDTGLEWISNQNRHPVIGQNIYRLKDGRFEQIGQGWLKHGFLALAQNLCCTCNNPNNGAILGVGCSDPYGSGLNGSQSGLGPRSDVNAHTGFYPYPFTQGNQGSTGNAIYKRIQVETDDLNPALNAGATYYGEGQYIAWDDAAAGNGNNNISWRGLSVGGTTGGYYNLSMSGSTVREEAAIQAWADADAGVVLTSAQVPNEGQFVVGSRAYDNGDGTWDYEYAVYNKNSDLSCGSISVPTQPGTTISGIGFHDVDYHSGEPYSGTDWVGSAGASSVDWSTDTFATDPNANAIRWGTLYNVRFTADEAPVSGDITLGLFKNGGSMSVAAEVPGPGVVTPFTITCDPNNDHSLGDNVKLNFSSFPTLTPSGLHLEATDGPPSAFGFFLTSTSATASLPVSNGLLCLDFPLARYNSTAVANQGVSLLDSLGQFDATGRFISLTGNSSSPNGSGFDVPLELPHVPSGQMIQTGDTHYFQLWYRDQPAGSGNFSNVLGATF